MLRMTLCVASLAVTLCGLRAEEKAITPKYVPLSPGRAVVEGDNLRCEWTNSRLVPYTVWKTEKKDGKLVTKDETLCRKEFYTERRLVPLNKAQAFVTTGQGADPTKLLRPLNTAKLKERLARDTRVFFLPDAGKMGPAYARELKAGNVVLVLPRP